MQAQREVLAQKLVPRVARGEENGPMGKMQGPNCAAGVPIGIEKQERIGKADRRKIGVQVNWDGWALWCVNFFFFFWVLPV
jgi:hypothetical protein